MDLAREGEEKKNPVGELVEDFLYEGIKFFFSFDAAATKQRRVASDPGEPLNLTRLRIRAPPVFIPTTSEESTQQHSS